MNLLFVDVKASLGGHTRTATTIARAFAERGHEVAFAVSDASNNHVIENAGFQRHEVKRNWTGHFPELVPLIGKLHDQRPLDVVHSFDWRGVAEALRAAKVLNVPFFQTICGGAGPTTPPLSRTLISLSHEVKDQVLRVSDLSDGDIAVIPARIDITKLGAQADAPDRAALAAFRAKYRLPEGSRVLMRIVRHAPEYEAGLIAGADAVLRLYRAGVDVRFVHIGFVAPAAVESYRRVQRHFAAVNQQVGTEVALTVQDEALEALRYLPLADVALASGRAAFEAMLFSKPVVISGVNGFAGRVDSGTVDEIAHYNFSGRNVAERKDEAVSVRELAAAIGDLLADRAAYDEIAAFGRTYVEENLDVRGAVDRYEARYRAFSPASYPTDAQIADQLSFKPRAFVKTLVPPQFHHRLSRLYSRTLRRTP